MFLNTLCYVECRSKTHAIHFTVAVAVFFFFVVVVVAVVLLLCHPCRMFHVLHGFPASRPQRLPVCAARWLSIWRKEMWMSHDKLPENPHKGLTENSGNTDSPATQGRRIEFLRHEGSIAKPQKRNTVCQLTIIRVSYVLMVNF